ncbi:hypothetical protein JZ751_019235 [Albula glossodonta]|uniref:Uncharacterized protein n=1 Tax=Albula glossodonta TaxID=121402 RepID=A0A8T2NP76_9TELE|nr:hypothetical protein JZ751_019235 [Albula glossodonta]
MSDLAQKLLELNPRDKDLDLQAGTAKHLEDKVSILERDFPASREKSIWSPHCCGTLAGKDRCIGGTMSGTDRQAHAS